MTPSSTNSQEPRTRLALGTVQFGLAYGVANEGGQVSLAEAARTVQLARDTGVDCLDTAIAYGESEQVLGRIGVADFKIVSKLPLLPETCSDIPSWVERELEASLRRLGVPSLHGLLLHRSAYLLGTTGDRLIAALERVQSAGLVRKIGVSIYDPSELDPIMGRARLELVQAPLNIMDRRMQTSGWLSRLQQAGVEVHTRSAFLQGLLLLPRERIPPKFKPWAALWDQWSSILKQSPQTAVEACLAYPLSRPEVSRVIVGVDNAEQLRALIAAQPKAHLSAGAAGPTANDWSCMISTDERLINPANWSRL